MFLIWKRSGHRTQVPDQVVVTRVLEREQLDDERSTKAGIA